MDEPKRPNSEAEIEAALAEAKAALEAAPQRALTKLRTVMAVRPGHPAAKKMLEALLRGLGRTDWQAQADMMVQGIDLDDPMLRRAAQALAANRPQDAAAILTRFLEEHPDDPPGLRLLAAARRPTAPMEALRLLERALEIAPYYAAARFDLASLLYRAGSLDQALDQIDLLLADQPERIEYLKLQAATLNRLNRDEEAIRVYEQALAADGEDAALWTLYGHALRSAGRRDDSVAAYRRAIALAPSRGRAWWSLANLKAERLDDADIGAMRAALAGNELTADDRVCLQFALGKALEDRQDYEESFDHYRIGNALVRSDQGYRPKEIPDHVERSKALFQDSFFARRKGYGLAAADPVFIIGMPRSGSTLVEQILASHSQIEGLSELPYIPRLSALPMSGSERGYPERLADLTHEQCAELGRRYLDSARTHRASGEPFFIDKNPNNWMHLGLIRLILPAARIVDVRRHPLDCGWSNFRQLFAQGHEFSYTLESIGEYYRAYVEMLDHFDRVQPGTVHRLSYEALVEDPETEVRTLLAYLGLTLEEECLRSHEEERAGRTHSSEQVRRPINREGIGQWRHYEPWLEPLKRSFGPALMS